MSSDNDRGRVADHEELKKACKLAEEIFNEYNEENIKPKLKEAAPQTYTEIDIRFGNPKLIDSRENGMGRADALGVPPNDFMPRHYFYVISLAYKGEPRRKEIWKIKGIDGASDLIKTMSGLMTFTTSHNMASSRPDFGNKIFISFINSEIFDEISQINWSKYDISNDTVKLLYRALNWYINEKYQEAYHSDKSYISCVIHEQSHVYLFENSDFGKKRKEIWNGKGDATFKRKNSTAYNNFREALDEGLSNFTGPAFFDDHYIEKKLSPENQNDSKNELKEADEPALGGYVDSNENKWVARLIWEKYKRDAQGASKIDYARELMRQVFDRAWQGFDLQDEKENRDIKKVFLEEILFEEDKKTLYLLNEEKPELETITTKLGNLEESITRLENEEIQPKFLQTTEAVKDKIKEIETGVDSDIYKEAYEQGLMLTQIHKRIENKEKEMIKALQREIKALKHLYHKEKAHMNQGSEEEIEEVIQEIEAEAKKFGQDL